jgi:Phosphoesterase family
MTPEDQAGTGRIGHVVVLMLENRAFDHMFGFLEHPGLTPLKPGDHPNHLVVGDASSEAHGVSADAGFSLPVDPPHSHLSVMKQLDGRRNPRMDGFLAAYAEKAAGREVLPIIHWLRLEGLLVVVSAVLAVVARLVGPRWAWSAAAGALILLGGTLGLLELRRRHLVARWWPLEGLVALAAVAFTLLARLVDSRWWRAAVLGAVLAAAGTGALLWLRSRPRYVRPKLPEEASRVAPMIMRCMPDRTIGALGDLARGFAVCTRWHCSVPGATWPNRNFAHAATSDGTTDIEIGLYDSRTVFELLHDAGSRCCVYYDGIAQVSAFHNVWESGAAQMRDFSTFEADVAAGRLARYSFIEPRHGGPLSNSQHPGNNLQPHDGLYDFQRGQALIARIYQALKGNRALFERTLLLITYDEHGGLFDHVAPPTNAPAPTLGKAAISVSRRFVSFFVTYRGSKFDFQTLGPRVPAVVVSPWVREGRVDDTLYDHTSIIATLRALFAPEAGPLTRRDRRANRFDHLVGELAEPRRSDQLPDLSGFLHPAPLTAPAVGPVPGAEEPGLTAAEAPGATAAEATTLDRAGEVDTFTVQLGLLAEKLDARLDQLGAATPPPPRPEAGLLADEADEAAEETVPHADVVRRLRAYCEGRDDQAPPP